jgi:hypothetical protein
MALTNNIITFDNIVNYEDLFNDTGNYSIVTYKYTGDEAGAYRFTSLLKFTWVCDGDGVLTADFYAYFYIKKNGTTVLDTGTSAHQTGQSGGETINLDTSFLNLDIGDTIEIQLTLTGTATNVSGTEYPFIFILNSTDSRFYNDADPRRGLNYPLTFADILPDVECIKFLQSINGLFNLWFYQNYHERDILIKQASDFHTTAARDWSAKLDLSKKVTVSKYEAPKAIEYSYSEDAKDYIVSNKAGYLSSDYTFDSSQKDAETVKQNYLTRTWFNFARRTGIATEKTIPVLWQEFDNAETAVPATSQEFKPRILKYDSNAALSTDRWKFEGTEKSTVPYFTESDLLPADIKGNYDWVHKNMERSKIIEAYFLLTTNDIADFVNRISNNDFRTPIYIDAPKFRGTYYVIGISGFDVVNEASVKVELLQANDKTINTIYTDSNWILLTGFWNDLGVWEDTAVWND